ncbi:MAG: response regulator transcription factor [Verrucomicrobiota bacterium]
MRNPKTSVVIVEDKVAISKQLQLILSQAPDIECIYVVKSAEEALRRIPQSPPNVVLMDIELPGMSGIEAVTALKPKIPDTEILMLTVYADADRVFGALKAGASGYLVKSSSPDELYKAIRDIKGGGSAFSAHIARRVVQYFRGPSPVNRTAEPLSPRETEVIELLASGYIAKEIGDQLGIGVETVRTHIKHICIKMQVRNRTEAVAKHRA